MVRKGLRKALVLFEEQIPNKKPGQKPVLRTMGYDCKDWEHDDYHDNPLLPPGKHGKKGVRAIEKETRTAPELLGHLPLMQPP